MLRALKTQQVGHQRVETVFNWLTPEIGDAMDSNLAPAFTRSASNAPMAHKKLNLPAKICPACERPFAWRKKWARDWEQVKFCSDRRRAKGTAVSDPT